MGIGIALDSPLTFTDYFIMGMIAVVAVFVIVLIYRLLKKSHKS